MGFGNKWRSWIRGCLESSRASVIVNGSPSKEFNVPKGVRQGDPLSPFLFIIAMEGLNVAMKAAQDKGLYKGVSIPNCDHTLSHLFYADDTLFFGDWSKENIRNLARILRCFHLASGLKVNFTKSKVFGIGVNLEETMDWAGILGCVSGSLPFHYLGVLVGANMNRTKNWQPIIDRFQSKLSSWKSKTLSFGGRLTLIKSVMGNLPNYFFSLFKAPQGVIDKLESIRRRFLWGGDDNTRKIHWVAWEKVVAPKNKGGLGVGSIKTLNIGLLVKWWWRLKSQPHSLWGKIINGIHNLAHKPPDHLSCTALAGVWNNIAGVKKMLSSKGLGFSDIFKVPNNQRNPPNDIWTCKISSNGKYSVAAMRSVIDFDPSITDEAWISWSKQVPMKVLCFIWRAARDRIPTAEALSHRGVSVHSTNCSFCNSVLETADHIMASCPLAKTVWGWIFKWIGENLPQSSTVKEIVDYAKNWGRCIKKRRRFETICYGVMWSLWIARNERVFNKRPSTAFRIVDEIMSLAFLWCKHRGNNKNLNWVMWCLSPFDCM